MNIPLMKLNKTLVRCHLFHKNLGLQSLQISSTFKFDFIFMEVDCHIFLINLVYRYFRFDIASILPDILGMSFPIPLLFSEKTWYNDYKYVIPSISHEKLGLTKKVLACFPILRCIPRIPR